MWNHDISGDLHITACLLDLIPCSKQLFKNLDLTGRAGAKTCCRLGSISPSQVSWLQRKDNINVFVPSLPPAARGPRLTLFLLLGNASDGRWKLLLFSAKRSQEKSINLNFQSSVSFPACTEEHSSFGKDRLIRKRSKAFATLISICRNMHCLENVYHVMFT